MNDMKNRKINILHYVEYENELGETDKKLDYLVKNIWAYYRHATTKETQQAIIANTEVQAVFKINWRNDIDLDCIIEYNGKKYYITDIDDLEGYKSDLKITAYTKDNYNENN
ncbi:phage head closure protein [Clostridium kluyveri]|uniref:Head-tail adaptor protein n=1 Tax=Clostridium kluyveri TaxID=1534 RepID=A0A1L5F2S1_CLOKL|nr:phage head closure protein [Clostridium kluyveri]APM37294.1 hypothetical protein BS101_00205 [Clostridium kluyveri]